MRRALARTATGFVLLLPLIAHAQDRRDASGLLPGCTYRQCELTWVPGRFGGYLQVGVNGASEIGSGFSGGAVRRAVSAVPAAELLARRGEMMQVTANSMRVISVIGTVLLWHAARRSPDPSLARPLALGLGVASFTLIPLVPQSIAHDRFHEATDAYNRELRR